jgi:hypothetical protein
MLRYVLKMSKIAAQHVDIKNMSKYILKIKIYENL